MRTRIECVDANARGPSESTPDHSRRHRAKTEFVPHASFHFGTAFGKIMVALAADNALAQARSRITQMKTDTCGTRLLDSRDEEAAVALLASAFSGLPAPVLRTPSTVPVSLGGARGGSSVCEPPAPAEAEPVFDWALGPRLRLRALHRARELGDVEARRARWFTWYLRWVLLAGLRYGLVLGATRSCSLDHQATGRGEELVAVLVALPPGRGWVADTSSWASLARPHIYALALQVGGPPPDETSPSDYAPRTSARMKAVGAAGVRARGEASSERGWHLYALAVAPAHQRSGCAASLLRCMAEIADADCVEVFAEAASERARHVLAAAGFVDERDATPLADAAMLPDGESPPRVTLMRRRAQRAP